MTGNEIIRKIVDIDAELSKSRIDGHLTPYQAAKLRERRTRLENKLYKWKDEQDLIAAKKSLVSEMFEAYVLNAVDPGDFYRMSNDEWREILPEIEESYQDIDHPFPFSYHDTDFIRTTVDHLLEQEFGESVMAEYAKQNC